jgi:hypothetical protein
MIKKILLPALVAIICFGCSKKQTPPPVVVTPPDTTTGKANNEHINVLTQHNDNTRAGFNSHETVLTTSNVNAQQFGKLFSLAVDDQIYAQPLVYSNLSIGSGTHNVVFIATVNNTVYAYDGTKGNLYWKKNFTASGMRPPNSNDMSSSWCTPYTDIAFNIGIIGTPVIDSTLKTIYFVARSTDGSTFVQYLHAVDLATGAEKAGSPVKIAASVPGTGDGNVSGTVSFDARRNNQRQGLTLVNGTVYITWASHCDWNPYHGWILGYNSSSLKQQIVYNDTPNGENGGLWESGMGMAADAAGNLYVTSGNGTVGTTADSYVPGSNGTSESTPSGDPTNLIGRGNSAIKLTPSGSTLQVTSYFTPQDYVNLNVNDLDYGVMGTFLIPGSNSFVTGCKDGNVYVLNKDNMGGFSPSANNVQQTIPLNDYLHCQPAFYKGANQYMYIWSENDQLRAFAYSGGQFANNPAVSGAPGPSGYCGADLSVSSNDSVSGTGIVWASYAVSGNAGNSVAPGILRAFDANDITKELWNSAQTAGDNAGDYAKYCSPTIVNGHVYLATFSKTVVVYGLK